jgi:hypothetical protein
MKKKLGTFRGNNLQNLNYEFTKGAKSSDNKTLHWMGAVSMNTTYEARSFLSQQSLNQIPDDLRIYLNSPNEPLFQGLPQFDFLRRSSTPYSNQDRVLFEDITSFAFGGIVTSLAAAGLVASAITGSPYLAFVSYYVLSLGFTIFPQKPDIQIFYKTTDINSLTASKFSLSLGQQLGLTYLFNLTDHNPTQPGANRNTYTESVALSSIAFGYTYDNYVPFGNGVPVSNIPYYYPLSNYSPGIIALWQSFAQHFGHTIADRIYGAGATDFELQGKLWQSANTSSHLKYLEEFNPQITAPIDYFNWIPVGLINDLMDNNIDQNPVVDNVSGFTYNELQTIYYNEPSTMQDFKTALKSVRPIQSLAIDQLFASYGY